MSTTKPWVNHRSALYENVKEWLRPSVRFVRRLLWAARRSYRIWMRPATIVHGGVRLPVTNLPRDMQDLLYCGRYENAEAQLVKDKLSPDDRVVEIGTGLGYLTTVCSRICGDGSVATYEANPEMVPIIETTYGLNHVRPKLRHAAITSSGQTVGFGICEKFWSSSTIPRKGTIRTVTVPGISFSKAVTEQQATFLLMDMEGGEVDLVEDVIPGCVRHMVIELHEGVVGTENVQKVRNWLRRNGFSPVVDLGDRSANYWRRE